MVSESILNYVCCPECEGELRKDGWFLDCRSCRKRYEITKGIPVLISWDKVDQHHRKQILYFGKRTKKQPPGILEEWQKSYIGRFNSCIPFADEDVVADIGTGSGYMAIKLAKRGNIVLACDLNLRGLIRLQRIAETLNLTKNLFLFACAAEKLPIKTELVDVFIANAVLEHLPREKAALAEIGRVCKKKASGFVTAPLRLKYIWPFFWPINIVHDKRIGHLRRYDLKDLEIKFGRYNFRVKEYFYTGHLVKTLGFLTQSLIRTQRFDKFLERVDRLAERRVYGANNIIITLER